jgi:hypothetical protein
MDHFEALAASSSVPFAARLTGSALRAVLASGVVPDEFWPHVNRALSEAPLEMLAGVLHEQAAGQARAEAVAKLRKVAAAVGAAERIEAWLLLG